MLLSADEVKAVADQILARSRADACTISMRGGDTAVVKGLSAKGTQSTDTFALKGIAQALDRVGQECK